MNGIAIIIFPRIAAMLPGLKIKLVLAGMASTPEEFVKKTFFTALYLSTGLFLVIITFLISFKAMTPLIFPVYPVLLILMFLYFSKVPDITMLKKEKEIDREIVFAGRFLVIEMDSGVPIYDSMVNVTKNYPAIGKYFKEMVDKISIGTPLEEAINETIEVTPSANFRKLMWQILNSLKTGADISTALNATIDHIANEQIIEIKDYGRKLNPMAMFYMIIAVILPSIGIVMLLIFSVFLGIKLDLIVLLTISAGLAFMQFMFYSLIKSNRPAVEI